MSEQNLQTALQTKIAAEGATSNDILSALTEINAKLLLEIAKTNAKMLTALNSISRVMTSLKVLFSTFISELGKRGVGMKGASKKASAMQGISDRTENQTKGYENLDKHYGAQRVSKLDSEIGNMTSGAKKGTRALGGMKGMVKGLSLKMFLLSVAVKLIGAFMSGLMTAIEPLVDIFTMFGEIIAAALMPIIMALFQALVPVIPILQEMIKAFMPLILVVALLITALAPLIPAFVELMIVANPAIWALLALTPIIVYLAVIIAVVVAAISNLAHLITGTILAVMTDLSDKWNDLWRVADLLTDTFEALENMANDVKNKLKQVKDWL